MGFSDAPQLERGLAQYEMDHFAILGVPLTANAKQISDSYKRVAKALRAGFVSNSEEAAQAGTLFAKWVNPAKEILTKDGERAEYETLLQLHIRRLVNSESQSAEELWPRSEHCDPLRRAADWQFDYQQRVAQIAENQYASLTEVVERTHQLSELNLAYLLLKAGAIKLTATPTPTRTAPAPAPSSATSNSTGSSVPFTSKPFNASVSPTDRPPRRTSSQPIPKPKENPAETRYKQAMDMMERGQYKEAVQFLGFAINEKPLPEYYLRRADAYFKQGIKGMARADYQQVLRLDPNNQEAKQGLRRVTPTEETATQSSSKKAPESKGGGFLGRLFGKK